MVIKTRSCDVRNYVCGIDGTYVSGVRIPGYKHKFVGSGTERLDSEGHPWNSTRRIPRGSRGDIGGGFSLQRKTFRSFPALVDASYIYGLGSGWYYSGEIHANTLGRSYGSNQLPDKITGTTLNFIGTKGIRNNPVQPQGDIGQFLGEIHDLPKAGLNSIKALKEQVGFFRSLGKDYLNYQFGWKPFLKSLRQHFKNCAEADVILRQLARDNGRYVRRSLNLPVEKDVTITNTKGYFTSPSLVSYLYDGKQQQFKTETYERNRWFRGRFRYWIPTMTTQSFWSIEANQQRNRLSRVVYGASMTPDLVWQLTPWSWLLDWYGNIGDIVSNMTDIELNNLHIDYAYAMCSERKETTWVVKAPFKGSGLVTCIAQDLEETKGRAPSSPFGFGFDMNSISPYQSSILAALSATRGKYRSR